MPRIKITGLPKAQIGIQSGFIQPANAPSLFTPTPSDNTNAFSNYAWGNNTVEQKPDSSVIKPAPVVTQYKLPTPQGDAIKGDANVMAIKKGKKLGQWVPKQNKTSFGQKILNTADTINTILPIANLATDMVTNTIKQKEWDKNMRREMFNINPIKWGEDRGDWETNTGILRPNQLSTPNIGMYAQDGMEVLSSDYLLQSSYIPDSPNPFINMPAISPNSKSAVTSSYIPEPNMGPVNNAVEALSSVQAKLESGYDPTKPPTAKENLKAWNLPASKTIYGKWQISQAERKEAYKNLPELQNAFPTFQQYNDAFLGRVNPEIQQQVQELTYKKFLAPRNLQLAGGDIYAAALYHYLPAAAKLYTQGKLDLSLKPGELFPNNKTLVATDNINPTFGSYLDRFKKEYNRQKKHNVFERGGQNNNTMKIKIVETPDEIQEMAGGGQPKYSGQSDYGLYIGQRNLYSSMPENPYKNSTNSVTEEKQTPEDPYVLEAEGGETILRPDGSHMNITGNRHTEGGEKLKASQAPEGSFIYSDTAKMKLKGKVLENFGKSANSNKKYTPAELAKQYNVNSYRAILQDPYTDKLSKDTAKRMIENYERKLAELALVQEGKKGFPQGIPDVAQKLLKNLQAGAGSQQLAGNSESGMQNAKYGGGLEKYQGLNNSTVTYDGKTWRKVNPDFVLGSDYRNVYSDKQGDFYQKPGTTSEKRKPVITPAYRAASPEKRRQMSQVAQADWAKTHQSIPEDRVFIPGTGRAEIVKVPLNIEQGVVDRKLPELKEPGKLNMSFTEKEKENEDNHSLGVGNFTPASNNIPYGWSDIDKLNVAGAIFGAPKKYLPWSPQMEVETYRPTFDDWRAKAATRQAATNNAMNTLGAYGPAQSLGANAAFMQGQQADQIVGDIAQTHSRNVDIANNAEAMNVQLRNAGKDFKMKRAKELYDAGIIAKQQYDNALNSYIKQGVVPSVTSAMKNAAYLYNQNISESPDYYIDPRTYRMMFNSKEAYNRFMNKNQGAYQADDAAVQARAKQVSDLMKTYNIDADTALEIMGIKGSGASKQKQTQYVQYPGNTMKNRIVSYGNNNAAAYGINPSVFDGYSYDNPLIQ